MAMKQWDTLLGWPGANAKHVRTLEPGWFTPSDWDEAHTWMQKDKANRVIEGVQRVPYGHNQVLWERVDKSKPIGFTRGPGARWLSFYPEAEQLGGCLHDVSPEFIAAMKAYKKATPEGH
eukprot:scaffold72715_cov51-Phaeocystis_antarctica.AAC.2